MNTAPRSYLTPADRDAAMIEASKLRAMSLRRESIGAFWQALGSAVQCAAHSVMEVARRTHPAHTTHKEA